ncbi:DNA topoisomerase-1 [Dyadobacter sp. BE34]|uniref:DNA topoisomerase 1 n=1 Tax=Dyadobacter fermentans TaxID=94254 RepID=A0ABU1QY36_9BACT|nr:MULTISPECIES: type I DNA topoisomerase [Dyadobacter]MDR6805640.1 DNA topoisomerase-1 [Dyadobacter fermentans]MDR7042600.1 DNA topoisomerase-1 [Dyadobacter sp. BE242]MDR7196912.1 DNA topoisomerase-1 [Dyadobacter sp. BE34]MDR7215653.1 DNA topoisomerase-1 [Dyadobacter sp. BE31]MDR7263189.1 DNA topoisomerase-1 [Dyadobacter sp. BE32]
MSKNLVIVESPAKAKTIESYLGQDFTVKSSFGHVRDLPEHDMGVDVEHGFQPSYEISSDKVKVISELKKLAKDAEVWLATDDDREGEAISWHLKEALGLPDNTKRIVFREITKTALRNAIEKPRTIDTALVDAQQARRILDRLVGYELSPVLWKKIRIGKSNLSAGRVQSVAVRIIVEREREIDAFKSKSSFKVTAHFDLGNGKVLNAELAKNFPTEQEAYQFLEKCIGAEFSIRNLEVKPAKKTPAPPFTTSTLQQEASRKLSFSVAQTMTVAQRLYEAGKISYMRTDSTNLSEEALDKSKQQITKEYGDEYYNRRIFKTKSESAQEAHEAIRPTDFSTLVGSSDRNEQRLYELIWKRAIASQMSDAQLERTTATIGISTTSEELVAQGEVIKFEGFLKVYLESSDDEGDEEQKGMLPPLNIGQVLKLADMKATERFTRNPPRYTEASLVKKLEEMGIGRPSTYAPTISTILKREYIVKEDRQGFEREFKEMTLANDQIKSKVNKEVYGSEKAKLFPTSTGMVVNDFLVSHFQDIVDYSFTASVEKDFDHIAEGQLGWQQMIKDFYTPFQKKVAEAREEAIDKSLTTRELGEDPATGKKVSVRIGKYGPYVQIGDVEDEEKPRFASLQKGQLMETITLDEAFELFKLPRQVGFFEDKDMVVNVGKFGPYVKHDGKYYSLAKTDDPMAVTEERLIEIIEEKRLQDSNRTIKEFAEDPEAKVLNGRYGPYIAFGKKNVKIPKGTEPASLTYDQVLKLAAETPDKPAGRGAKKPAAAKATAAKAPAAKKPAAKKATKKG